VKRVAAWLKVASRPAVLKRSMAAGAINPTVAVQILLTYLVPLLVSTAASVSAIQGRGDEGHRT